MHPAISMIIPALSFLLFIGCEAETPATDTGPDDAGGHDADVDADIDGGGHDADPEDASADADTLPDARDTDIPIDADTEENPFIFNILIRQTHQACDSCGIWFDWQGVQEAKPRLVVRFQLLGEEQTRTYQHGLDGEETAIGSYIAPSGLPSPEERLHSLLIKDVPRRVGLFQTDMSDIPSDAEILEARLHLHIHTGEGLANSDHSSVLAVYECLTTWSWSAVSWETAAEGVSWTTPGGDSGALVREIRAQEDLWDRGFSKASPNAHFDFTVYVVELQRRRSE